MLDFYNLGITVSYVATVYSYVAKLHLKNASMQYICFLTDSFCRGEPNMLAYIILITMRIILEL